VIDNYSYLRNIHAPSGVFFSNKVLCSRTDMFPSCSDENEPQEGPFLPTKQSGKNGPLQSSRHHLLLLHRLFIPRVVTPVSPQNPQKYHSHRFHRLGGRMGSPRNCPVHSHLTPRDVFTSRNTRHYLQRTVVLYKNSRLCCKASSKQRTV